MIHKAGLRNEQRVGGGYTGVHHPLDLRILNKIRFSPICFLDIYFFWFFYIFNENKIVDTIFG